MADENVQARKRAAKRSLNFKAGKPLDDAPDAAIPQPDAAAPEEGGIVAEAKDEAAKVEAVEEAQEGGTGSPAEEAAEGEPAPTEAPVETPEEAPTEPTAETAEDVPAEAPAEPPVEAAPEPMAEMPMDMPMEQAPEASGPSHDELIDQYHEALAYGDVEQARELYKQLQDVRYRENTQRTRAEGEAAKEMAEYVATAQELASQHPELAEDGEHVEEVMTLADLYRSKGASPSDALRQAVAKLYPEAAPTVAEEPAPAPAEEAPEIAAEAAPEPEAEPKEEAKSEEEAATEETPVEKAEENPIPDMSARKARKANLSVVPTASARNEPPAKKEEPTRSTAIAEMRKRRGQG